MIVRPNGPPVSIFATLCTIRYLCLIPIQFIHCLSVLVIPNNILSVYCSFVLFIIKKLFCNCSDFWKQFIITYQQINNIYRTSKFYYLQAIQFNVLLSEEQLKVNNFFLNNTRNRFSFIKVWFQSYQAMVRFYIKIPDISASSVEITLSRITCLLFCCHWWSLPHYSPLIYTFWPELISDWSTSLPMLICCSSIDFQSTMFTLNKAEVSFRLNFSSFWLMLICIWISQLLPGEIVSQNIMKRIIS